MAKGSWEVSEAEYSPSGNAPGEDTETFYAGTPAPGQRQHFDKPPESKPGLLERATPGWIKRVSRPEGDTLPNREEEAGSSLPLGLISVGIVAISGMMITLTLVGWFVFSPGTVTESSRSAKQDAGEEEPQKERYQGVKVKKGLQ